MLTEPLSDYFARIGSRPRFLCRVTSLLRGYLGTWETADERLYLRAPRGVFEDDTPFSVATFFPEHPDRVFADWYSGTLRIPQGKQLQ